MFYNAVDGNGRTTACVIISLKRGNGKFTTSRISITSIVQKDLLNTIRGFINVAGIYTPKQRKAQTELEDCQYMHRGFGRHNKI